MNKDSGGYAFPAHDSMGACIANGMTLRDWFAGQVLASLAATFFQAAANKGLTGSETKQTLAETAYEMADAMLVERSKQ